MNRDVERLCRELRSDGLTVLRARSGHLRVELPDGRFVWTVPATPSDPRALRNCRAAIRRQLRKLGHVSEAAR